MDYCSSCRRHLNGALVCPGCGAYAPDIAPVVTDGRLVSASATMVTATATDEAGGDRASVPALWHDGRPQGETPVGTHANGTLSSDTPDDLQGVPIAPEGRAARRRQRARWKKNQRRAVVATAVALVGGGLTVSAMDREAGDRAQAATAPQDPGMGTLDEQPAQNARTTSIPPHTHASGPPPQGERPAPDAPRRQAATDALPATPPSTQGDPAASPGRNASSVSQPKNSSPALAQPSLDRANDSDGMTTPAEASPGSTDSTGTGTGRDAGSTGSEPPQAGTAPTSTSPSEICVLVVCLPLS